MLVQLMQKWNRHNLSLLVRKYQTQFHLQWNRSYWHKITEINTTKT